MPYAPRENIGFTYLGPPEFVTLYKNICEYKDQLFMLLPMVSSLYRFQNVRTGMEITTPTLGPCWIQLPDAMAAPAPGEPNGPVPDPEGLYYPESAIGGFNAIYGTQNFDLINLILIGDTAATDVTVANDGFVMFTVPVMPPGVYTVTLGTVYDDRVEVPGTLTIAVAPTLTAITPNQIPMDGGLQLTLTGSGFAAFPYIGGGASFVEPVSGEWINADNSSFYAMDDTTMVFCCPPVAWYLPSAKDAVGTVLDLHVWIGGSEVVMPAAVVVVPDNPADPQATSLDTTTGMAGDVLTVSGTMLSSALDCSFQWNDGLIPANNFTPIDDTSFQVTVPNGLPAQTDIMLVMTSKTSNVIYLQGWYFICIVLGQPVPEGGTPAAAMTGTQIEIWGTTMLSATGVLFGTVPGDSFVNNNDDGSVMVNVPAGLTPGQVYDITVESPFGNGVMAQWFTSLDALAALAVYPPSVPQVDGPAFQVQGTGFYEAYTGQLQVSIQGSMLRYGTDVTIVSDTELSCTSPNFDGSDVGYACTIYVSRGIDNQNAMLADALTVSAAPPTVTQMTPTAGEALTQVTMYGVGFSDVQQVLFGTTPGYDLTVYNDGELIVFPDTSTPLGVCDVTLVSATWGQITMSQAFTVLDTLEVTNVTPVVLHAAGGALLTVTGQGFAEMYNVTLNGPTGINHEYDCTNITVVSSTQLTCTAPAITQPGDVPGNFFLALIRKVDSAGAGTSAYIQVLP